MKNLYSCWLITPVLMGVFLVSHPIQAAVKTFYLVPEESTVTLSGQALGLDIKEQGPGSLTSRFQGTIQAAIEGNHIQFVTGSDIDALTNGNWEPLPGGASGKAPADYGGTASSLILGTAKAAVREVELDLMSSPIPLTNGVFDASTLVFFFPTNTISSFDYRISSFLLTKEGSELLGGYSTNKVAAGASLVSDNGAETLTIPIEAEFFFELLSPNDTRIKLQGQLVARSGSSGSLKIDSISTRNQVVTLSWHGETGATYRVESSPDLRTWTVRENALTASSSVVTWNTNTSGSTEYFRIGR